MHRCYTPPLLIVGELRIEGSEAHHLSNVLRAKPGDTVEVFDGEGASAIGTISSVTKRGVGVRIDRVVQTPDDMHRLILATAVPKGERCDWLVEKATELGVTCWMPLTTERSVVDPREGKLDRLRQIVISACKQSGRNWLMEIAPVASWVEFVAVRAAHEVSGAPRMPLTSCAAPFLIATPSGRPWAEVVSSAFAEELCIAIGPEGGWTDGELEMARQHHAELVSLGPHILRIETAAIAVAAAWRLSRCHEPSGTA